MFNFGPTAAGREIQHVHSRSGQNSLGSYSFCLYFFFFFFRTCIYSCLSQAASPYPKVLSKASKHELMRSAAMIVKRKCSQAICNPPGNLILPDRNLVGGNVVKFDFIRINGVKSVLLKVGAYSTP